MVQILDDNDYDDGKVKVKMTSLPLISPVPSPRRDDEQQHWHKPVYIYIKVSVLSRVLIKVGRYVYVRARNSGGVAIITKTSVWHYGCGLRMP